MRKLRSDKQFEKAYYSRSPVCVRDRGYGDVDFIGSLEAYTPVVVTVGGRKFLRDECDFVVVRS